MIAIVAALALAGQTAPAEAAWTWTLYDDTTPVVLANEIPDTPSLRATLECDPASGVARIILYGGSPDGGMARITAGQTSAMAQAEAQRGGALKLALPTDHPVFAAFAADGRMSIAVAEQRQSLEVPRAHLAKLRRFAELCSG
ncbi:hypothetical protein [Brevundimonas sp. Root1279]|uniref:hypothetical protein n=1 Tax=Brevundimonas sp. Root1279 TaxID=1736443 RepID=UPI0006F62751|nr:hypothetical protein [Brevundimonas sp. Root1279]KQW78734.1 hypothetical protein ASC65_15560 [Brevundimonas sp. Root1279]